MKCFPWYNLTTKATKDFKIPKLILSYNYMLLGSSLKL